MIDLLSVLTAEQLAALYGIRRDWGETFVVPCLSDIHVALCHLVGVDEAEKLEGRWNLSTVTEMGLCEAEHIGLRPGQLYRFVVMPGCAECAKLVALAEDGLTVN